MEASEACRRGILYERITNEVFGRSALEPRAISGRSMIAGL